MPFMSHFDQLRFYPSSRTHFGFNKFIISQFHPKQQLLKILQWHVVLVCAPTVTCTVHSLGTGALHMVRRHETEEFHGTNMEEYEKEEFWLEKLQRILKEVRCPPDQRVSCVVSLLQSEAYDWWKLALRSSRIPNHHDLGVLCPRVQGKVCY